MEMDYIMWLDIVTLFGVIANSIVIGWIMFGDRRRSNYADRAADNEGEVESLSLLPWNDHSAIPPLSRSRIYASDSAGKPSPD